GARGDVAWREVAVARILALEVVIALPFRDLLRPALVALLLRHPDAPVVAQRLRHQGQLRLVVAALRDAGRMDLRVAGIGEIGTAPMRAPDRGGIRRLRVGGEVEDVRVAAGAEDDGVAGVRIDRAGDHVAGDDALGLP